MASKSHKQLKSGTIKVVLAAVLVSIVIFAAWYIYVWTRKNEAVATGPAKAESEKYSLQGCEECYIKRASGTAQ